MAGDLEYLQIGFTHLIGPGRGVSALPQANLH